MLAFSEISLSFKNARDVKTFPGLERVWAYLEQRGIDRLTVDLCGLHVMQAVELIAAARRSPAINGVDNRAAIVFPHYRLGDLQSPMEWWSARLVPLADPQGLRVVASFGDLVDPVRAGSAKLGKMFCPPNEAPHAYLPPVYPWKDLCRGQRVFIHESALKALNGALLGAASVGLNGVWGWGSRKHQIALIAELRDLPWRALELQPVIVYDSNAWDNWQVQAAEAGLAGRLFEITGRMAFALRVPKPAGGGDEGFDDFRMRVGDAAARAFLEGPGVEISVNEIELMKLELNSLVCVVRSMGLVAEQGTATVMSGGTFTNLNYAHYTATVEDGERLRQVNVPKLWLADPRRAEVERLEYAPGDGRLIRGGTGLPLLNTWRGMGCDPEPGDVDQWLDLLVNGVPDARLRQWLIAWMAYPLQNPGRKTTTYPLVFGPSGVGKNLVFKPLHHIYGDNAVLIGKENILSSFNSVYANKQLIHLDELQRARGDGEDQVTQKVKMLTTGEKMVVNQKGVAEYTVRNVAALAITSNYWDCIKLDADDRRATVIRWDPVGSGGVDRRGDQAYWTRYVRWVEGGGFRAVYQWLLDQDLSEFDPAAWAPETPWKEQVKEATMSEQAVWVKDLWDNPDAVLGLGELSKSVFTAKELCVLCYAKAEADITSGAVRSMGAELRNRGFRQAGDGKAIRRPGGGMERWWVVRMRSGEWTASDVANHLKRR